MTRGVILGLTDKMVVQRATSMVGFRPEVHGPRRTNTISPVLGVPVIEPPVTVEGQYCMDSGRNGGDDPRRPHPFTIWQHEKKGTVATADCVGFVMWTQGADRKLEGLIHDYEGGWVNTDSMLLDAAGDQELFEECAPFPGCIVVYGGRSEFRYVEAVGDGGQKYQKKVRKRIPGHCGTVISVLPAKGREKALVQVAHCHGPALKGPAVSIADAGAWLKHGGKFLRFKVKRDGR